MPQAEQEPEQEGSQDTGRQKSPEGVAEMPGGGKSEVFSNGGKESVGGEQHRQQDGHQGQPAAGPHNDSKGPFWINLLLGRFRTFKRRPKVSEQPPHQKQEPFPEHSGIPPRQNAADR